MENTLRALYDEHESIAAVLHALQYLARELEQGNKVDPQVFKQILYYLDVFPERFHHPKEDEVLFKAVRERTNAGEEVIAKLEKQHEAGASAIRQLEQTLLRWETGGANEELKAFVDAATSFVVRYREHMRIEEDELMPLARRTLTSEDWDEVEAAFAEHQDPLHGATPDADPKELFRRILYLAPPPIGLGKPA